MTMTNSNRSPLPFLFTTLLFLLLLLSATAYGRHVTDRPSSDLVSDRVHDGFQAPPLHLLRINQFRALDSCDQTYGFMPCTTTVLGNLFLIIVYEYLMFLTATYLSSGSELLLEILGPGIIGGLFLPILGALPDAMLILGTNLLF
ncbi:hypothetical protein CsSME_00018648 [Camellia sinensis var. sinensis]